MIPAKMLLARLALIACVVPVMAAAPAPGQLAARPGAARPAARTPVLLQSQPGSALERTAIRLVAQEMSDSSRAQQSLVLVGTAPLGAARDPDAIFVQVQSARECGSSGCSTSVYFRDRKVLDSVSGAILADAQRHKGMRDLIVGENERYVWDGTAYRSTQPAPAIDLQPRPRRNRG